MDQPEQRPRFEARVAMPPQEVSALLAQGLATEKCPCVGSVTRNHAWIHLRESDRHFWSPTLDLSLEATDDGTLLRGRFGPHPSVWTLFVFIYAGLGLSSLIASMFGVAQITLDRTPWGFAASAGLVALICFVYGAAFIGEGLGSQQMTQISIFLDRVVVRPSAPSTPQR